MSEDKVTKLVELAKESYSNAQRNKAKISNDWRIMDQYSVSSKRFKLLLNNLCSVDNFTYLELGCFRGGTLCGALFQNKLLAAYAIDNFQYNPLDFYTHPETGERSNINPNGWDNVKLNLIDNLERLKLDKSVKLFVGDWNKISDSFIKHKINIVHLDIPKETDKILEFYDSKFDDVFILVVSNFNSSEIQNQVDAYIDKKNYTVHHKITNFSHSNADSEGWWNGLGVLVIQKLGKQNEKEISNQPNQL